MQYPDIFGSKADSARRFIPCPVPARSSSFCHDRKRCARRIMENLLKLGHFPWLRPPLPFFFTTSWVIYVRAGCRLFLLSFSHLTSRTQVQACRKSLFFNLSDAGLKHFIISHCADPLFRVMSNGARVFTAFRLRLLFEIIFKFPRDAFSLDGTRLFVAIAR